MSCSLQTATTTLSTEFGLIPIQARRMEQSRPLSIAQKSTQMILPSTSREISGSQVTLSASSISSKTQRMKGYSLRLSRLSQGKPIPRRLQDGRAVLLVSVRQMLREEVCTSQRPAVLHSMLGEIGQLEVLWSGSM